MYREIPASNKMLQRRWQQQEFRIHKKKLKEVKSWIDFKKPQFFGKSKGRAKRGFQLEGNYVLIILLLTLILDRCYHFNNLITAFSQHKICIVYERTFSLQFKNKIINSYVKILIKFSFIKSVII